MRYFKRRTDKELFLSKNDNDTLREIEDISLFVAVNYLSENNTILEVQVEYPDNEKTKDGNQIMAAAGFVKDLHALSER